MENKDALDFFHNMSEKSQDPKSVKLANSSDFSSLDADFILKYADKNTNILDLGSGTGLIVNKIYDKVGHVTAVEPFPSFTKFIVPSDNVTVVNKTFDEFTIERTDYDIITVFGVMHYFNESESVEIYKKFYSALRTGGRIIIKNQFGVQEDVVVEGYSEEQKSNYYAQYRYIEKEVSNLSSLGYNNVVVVDIYPPECNRWENTHFYAIVAEK
jgi:SAM-dependent methyltransferase